VPSCVFILWEVPHRFHFQGQADPEAILYPVPDFMNELPHVQTRGSAQVDNEIRALQNELKSRKARKDGLSKQLILVMKTNEIDTFDINNGSIEFKQKTAKKPLTKKMLLSTLNTFFEGDVEKTAQLTDFINEKRELYTKENIVRKVHASE